MRAIKLIILEGPAGVGKTTLQRFLYKKIKTKGLNVGILPEFSQDKFGRLIENNCQFGQKKPEWLTEVGGLWIFLSHKINQLEIVLSKRNKIWILDRYLLSQFILGLRLIEKKEDKIFARKTIQLISDWIFKKISKQSFVIFLDAEIEILQKRLEQRINRKLSSKEIDLLKDEIKQYRILSESLKIKNVFKFQTDNSTNVVGEKVFQFISTKWHL